MTLKKRTALVIAGVSLVALSVSASPAMAAGTTFQNGSYTVSWPVSGQTNTVKLHRL